MPDPEETISDLREQLIEVVLREAATIALGDNGGKLRHKLFDAVDKQAEVAAREALAREGGITLSDEDIDRIADAVAQRLANRGPKRGLPLLPGNTAAASDDDDREELPKAGLAASLGAMLESPAIKLGLGGLLIVIGGILAWFLWLKPDPVMPPPSSRELASPAPSATASTVSCSYDDSGLGDCRTAVPGDTATATPTP